MEDYRNKSRFLYGESMGGAVALMLHRKDPTFWDGAVLVAPMCKVWCYSIRLNPHGSELAAWLLKCGLFA
jgi:caffeoylshikimate esterase